MSEAEYLYDLGIGDMVNEEFEEERIIEILDDRERRKIKLIGKYVIACDGHKSKKICFLQNKKISNKGYWTNFLSNALGFNKLTDAEFKLKNLKYNNPRIIRVTKEFLNTNNFQ